VGLDDEEAQIRRRAEAWAWTSMGLVVLVVLGLVTAFLFMMEVAWA
jgi:hypothetical protein